MEATKAHRGLSTARAALRVTWLLARAPEGVRADQVASTLGKSVSTAYNLLASLWNTLKAPPLLAIVHFGELQASMGRDRRGWAQSLHADVQSLRRELR